MRMCGTVVTGAGAGAAAARVRMGLLLSLMLLLLLVVVVVVPSHAVGEVQEERQLRVMPRGKGSGDWTSPAHSSSSASASFSGRGFPLFAKNDGYSRLRQIAPHSPSDLGGDGVGGGSAHEDTQQAPPTNDAVAPHVRIAHRVPGPATKASNSPADLAGDKRSRTNHANASPLGFAIVNLGRSGSTYLYNMLDSHPDLQVYGEILHTLTPENRQAVLDGHDGNQAHCVLAKLKPRTNHWSAVEQKEFLDLYWRKMLCTKGFCDNLCDPAATPVPGTCHNCPADGRPHSRPLVGVKLLVSQFKRVRHGLKLYRRGEVKILRLLRRDMFMRTLSAMDRRATAAVGGGQPEPISPVELMSRLAKTIEDEKAMNETLESVGNLDILTLWYEDLVEAEHKDLWNSGPWRAITDFLGVPPAPLHDRTKLKHSKATLAEVKEGYPNIEELLALIRARFGSELHDLIPPK